MISDDVATKFINQHAQVLDAVRELGKHSCYGDARHLIVPVEYADRLFDVVYGFDDMLFMRQELLDASLRVKHLAQSEIEGVVVC